MKLSSRSRQGFRAILELAFGYGGGPLQIKTIAKHQEISVKYLEQLIAMLKSAGIVNSIRGPKGGYILTRPPNQIKLSDIFIALEGHLIAAECLQHPDFCQKCADCVTRQLWYEMQNAVMSVLDVQTLQDLVDRAKGADKRSNFQI